MRRISITRTLLLAGTLAAPAAACTISVKAQTKYVPQAPLLITAQTPWKSQPIDVTNTNGSVRVIGDPGATTVSVSAVPFAFADTQGDGDLGVQDVTATLALEESATRFYAHCDIAATDHGSATSGGTGCELTVTVPVGSAAQGVPLTVSVGSGRTTVENVVGDAARGIVVLTQEGSVTVRGITGGCRARTANGELALSITPTRGSTVEAWTENGAATLSLPATFATDRLSMVAVNGRVVIVGFEPALSASTTRGVAGTGAASITLISNAGDATLTTQ